MSRDSSPVLLGAACVALVLLAVNIGLTLRNTRQLKDDFHAVAHTHAVVSGLERVSSLAKDAETGQRGYLITGAPQYLDPYNAGVAGLRQTVDDLQRLTADSAAQQARFPELRQHLERKLKELEETIALRRGSGFDAAREVVKTDRGKNEMEAIRSLLGQMIEHEHNLLRQRSERTQRTYWTAIITGLVSGLSALAAVGALMLVIRRHLAMRSQAADVLGEQKERLRTTLASIGDAVITTDTEGRVTNINASAETLTEWTNSEAVGQPLADVFRIVNESTRLTVESPVTKAIRDGAIVGLANHTVLIGKHGGERAIDDSAAPIRCARGEIVGCVLVFRDISERREAEERERALLKEAAEANTKFRAFFDQGALFAGIMDVDGTIVEVNRLALEASGYRREDVIGRKFWECPWWSPSAALAECIRAASVQAAAGETFRTEMPYFIAGGDQRMVDIIILPVKDDDGRIGFLAPTGTDITERKRLESDLRQSAANLSDADRRKNEFLAMLAHELRNPMAPIRNALQIIRLADGNGASVRSAADVMERQVGHMVRLVDDLLDVSRISRGTIEVRKGQVELASVVNHAVEAARPGFDDKNIALAVTLPPQPVHVDGDPTRLTQVVGNLLSNACKFTRPGGDVQLTVAPDGDEAIIRVRDNGIGIADDQRHRIFEMFAQVDTSLERSQGGLGIGLTLVQRIVEIHGGEVQVHSAGLGQGSEFVVHLPRVAPQSPAQSAPAPSADGTRAPRRILVVDDNHDSAESLALLLSLQGHETRTAFDGLEAVEAAEAFRPDVVFLDIGLPKLSGYEVAERIRQQPWGKRIVLVALTGWGQDEDRSRSTRAGFDQHLVKPIDPPTLTDVLARLVDHVD